jgi:murein DD-endopeptidase MepM/ murein hydrolase activator NlpD
VLLAWQHRRLLLAVAGVTAAAVIFGPLLLMSAMADLGGAADQQFVAAAATPIDSGPIACVITPAPGGPTGAPAGPTAIPGLAADQVAVATQIIATAKALHVSAQGQAVAIATGLVESTLTNLDYGLDSSLGVFQQLDAWGPAADRMDVAKSAAMFFQGGQGGQRGLLGVPGWEGMSIGQAAQAVQASAFPDRYQEKAAQAAQIVTALTGVTAGVCGPTGGGDGKWVLPLAKGTYTLSSGFGMRTNPVTGIYTLHAGVDFAAPTGTPIYAAAAGVVTAAGPAGSAGNMTVITLPDGTVTRYMHQSQIGVQAGEQVTAGQRIGAVGTTGNSTGAHLHFEVRPNDVPIDPLPFLRAHGLTP